MTPTLTVVRGEATKAELAALMRALSDIAAATPVAHRPDGRVSKWRDRARLLDATAAARGDRQWRRSWR
jgi:hypothetical protein